MDQQQLAAAAALNGFRTVERSQYHTQIFHGETPLVDVWPTKNKYLRCKSKPGEKARVGNVEQALKLAREVFSADNRPAASLNGHDKAAASAPTITDQVNHPAHYTIGKMEVIEAIEGLQLGFHAGNVLKYIARYKLKGGVQDLKKAAWYLQRLIDAEAPVEDQIPF